MPESIAPPLRVSFEIPAGIYTCWDDTAVPTLAEPSTTGLEVYIPLRAPLTGDSNGI